MGTVSGNNVNNHGGFHPTRPKTAQTRGLNLNRITSIKEFSQRGKDFLPLAAPAVRPRFLI